MDFFLSGAWVKADAATDRTVLLFDVLRSLLALEATFFDVFSFFPIAVCPFMEWREYSPTGQKRLNHPCRLPKHILERSKIQVVSGKPRWYTMEMKERPKSKKLDLNQLEAIVDHASGERELLAKAIKEGKNPAAVLLGRLGGLKGGKARAAALSAERRIEIGKQAVETRWRRIKEERDA